MEPFEHSFQCPWCLETISMVIEPQTATQKYVEDCEVCCRPIRVSFAAGGDEETEGSEDGFWFEADRS